MERYRAVAQRLTPISPHVLQSQEINKKITKVLKILRFLSTLETISSPIVAQKIQELKDTIDSNNILTDVILPKDQSNPKNFQSKIDAGFDKRYEYVIALNAAIQEALGRLSKGDIQDSDLEQLFSQTDKFFAQTDKKIDTRNTSPELNVSDILNDSQVYWDSNFDSHPIGSKTSKSHEVVRGVIASEGDGMPDVPTIEFSLMYDESSKILEELKAKLEQLRCEQQTLQSQKSEIETRQSVIETDLDAASISKDKAEVQKLRKQRDSASSELHVTKTNIDKISDELCDTQKAIDELLSRMPHPITKEKHDVMLEEFNKKHMEHLEEIEKWRSESLRILEKKFDDERKALESKVEEVKQQACDAYNEIQRDVQFILSATPVPEVESHAEKCTEVHALGVADSAIYDTDAPV